MIINLIKCRDLPNNDIEFKFYNNVTGEYLAHAMYHQIENPELHIINGDKYDIDWKPYFLKGSKGYKTVPYQNIYRYKQSYGKTYSDGGSLYAFGRYHIGKKKSLLKTRFEFEGNILDVYELWKQKRSNVNYGVFYYCIYHHGNLIGIIAHAHIHDRTSLARLFVEDNSYVEKCLLVMFYLYCTVPAVVPPNKLYLDELDAKYDPSFIPRIYAAEGLETKTVSYSKQNNNELIKIIVFFILIIVGWIMIFLLSGIN